MYCHALLAHSSMLLHAMRAVLIQTLCRTAAACPPPCVDCSATNVQVYYVLDHPKGKDWKGGVGYVTEEMAKASLLHIA